MGIDDDERSWRGLVEERLGQLEKDKQSRRRASDAVKAEPSLRCYFCGATIQRLEELFIEFYDQELPPFISDRTTIRFNAHGGREEIGALAYPGGGEWMVQNSRWSSYDHIAVFTHQSCGPDVGYWVPGDRLDEDWESHLSRKPWWHASLAAPMSEARRVFNVRITKREF